MTIIAWDGTHMAADRLSCGGNTKSYTIKIARIHGHLVGAAGRGTACVAFMNWFEDGAEPEDFPRQDVSGGIDGGEPESNAMVITPEGEVLVFENSPHPMRFLDKNYAIGSGANYAKAAMFLGLTAAQAVTVACQLDPNCGGDVDELPLYDPEADARDLADREAAAALAASAAPAGEQVR